VIKIDLNSEYQNTLDKDNLFLVGIDYDPKTKEHSCKIEKYNG